VQLGLVFDRERSKMGIGGEVAGRPEFLEKSEQDVRMPRTGIKKCDARLREPGACVRGGGPRASDSRESGGAS
jgi:hypothetical protein